MLRGAPGAYVTSQARQLSGTDAGRAWPDHSLFEAVILHLLFQIVWVDKGSCGATADTTASKWVQERQCESTVPNRRTGDICFRQMSRSNLGRASNPIKNGMLTFRLRESFAPLALLFALAKILLARGAEALALMLLVHRPSHPPFHLPFRQRLPGSFVAAPFMSAILSWYGFVPMHRCKLPLCNHYYSPTVYPADKKTGAAAASATTPPTRPVLGAP